MAKKLNGTLMVCSFGNDNTARKVFDLKVTNTWPILSISKKHPQFFRDNSGKTIPIVKPFQHISIPPDLRLHLTEQSSGFHYFLYNGLVNTDGTLKNDFVHLLSWLSLPIDKYPQPRGKWQGAELHIFKKDEVFTQRTGIFIDLFAHNNENVDERLSEIPFLNSTMRFFHDNAIKGRIIRFKDLIRKQNLKIVPKFYLTLRYGFWECLENNCVIYLPLIKIKINRDTSYFCGKTEK